MEVHHILLCENMVCSRDFMMLRITSSLKTGKAHEEGAVDGPREAGRA